MAALNAEHAGNFAGLARLANVIGSGCQGEDVAVGANDFARDGNLLELRTGEVAVSLLTGDIDAPELRLNAAGTQARNIRLARCTRT